MQDCCSTQYITTCHDPWQLRIKRPSTSPSHAASWHWRRLLPCGQQRPFLSCEQKAAARGTENKGSELQSSTQCNKLILIKSGSTAASGFWKRKSPMAARGREGQQNATQR